MSRRDKLRHHADLVDRMATTLGVDLQQAAIEGGLKFDEISDAVLRCVECPNPSHCHGFLSKNHSVDRAPEFCRNTQLLNRLMR